ncbi:MAG: hypothetical protein MZV65_33200 [Chromatiales bacterium]|nr:hypothetical protein [Chromatiales bacterium]
MNIALVVTREGMPLGYEIFAGQHGRREHGRGDRRARWRRASATRTGCG